MWVLEGNSDLPGYTHYLHSNTTLKVSRGSHQGHIGLHNDKSISRQHATLFVHHEPENLSKPSVLPKLIVTDLKSTYGTFVNENIEEKQKIPPDVPYMLKNQDRIRFGILSNLWRVKYSPFILTTSQVADKASLGAAILSIGGHLVSNWTQGCTHLVMNEVILTIKTVCALASCKPIVTPEYVYTLKSAIQNKEAHPTPSDYLPPIKEISISSESVSFAPDERRRSLFAGKTFIFCNEKTFKRMEIVITLAGGSALLINSDTFHMILKDRTVVVKPTEDKLGDASPLVIKALDVMKQNNLFCIPESDIGLALLYISTTGYCNPRFNTRGLLRPAEYDSQAFQSLKIYATETQDMETQKFSLMPSKTVIPDSGQSKKSSGQRISSSNIANQSLDPTVPAAPVDLDTCISDIPTQKFESDNCINQNENKENNISNKRRLRSNSDEGKAPLNKKSKTVMEDTQDMGNVNFDPKFCSTPRIDISEDNSQRIPTRAPPQHEGKQNFINPRNPTSTPSEQFTLPFLKTEPPSQSQDWLNSASQSRSEPIQDVGSSDGYERPYRKRECHSPSPNVDRKRRTNDDNFVGRANTRNHEPSASDKVTGNSEFALPVACTSRRRGSARSNLNNSSAQPTQTIKRSPSDLMRAEETTQGGSFGSQTAAAASSSKPFIQAANVTIKQETSEEGDESGLAKAFEKSLVVVKIASLVKNPNHNNSSTSSSLPSSSLPNFKNFKKRVSGSSMTSRVGEVCVLPQIIGEGDLFVNDETSNRRDEFISSQTHLNETFQAIEQERAHQSDTGQFSVAEKEFNLPMAVSGRRARQR